MHSFKEGELLNAVWCSQPDGFYAATGRTDAYGARSITVSMEAGQLANVPWAICEMVNGRTIRVNLAMAEAVGIADDGEG